jgi:hypothetical protein
MKPVNVSKSSMTLPNRAAMNTLGKGSKSILDYSKASPMNRPDSPMMIANLAKKGK